MTNGHAHALNSAAIRERLADLMDWVLEDDGASIAKSFRFTDFSEAFAFMARTALMAEKLDHHPDWSNVYNRVDVRLTTHDAGGLTNKDFAMARAMDVYATS